MRSFVQQPVLELQKLSIHDKKKKKTLLQPLDLAIQAGEMVGLVGESGSGKSITASAIIGLLPKQLQAQGRIQLKGQSLSHLSQKELRQVRGRDVAMVFQDYNGSLTPFVKVGKQMVEAIRIHQSLTKKQAQTLAVEALERVHLPGERVFNSYPYQLSGGQKQRVAIAMAMIHRPALLLCDEPTTALDVVTGNHILTLIDELRRETNCAVLYITHHLCEVLERADRVAVMYGGSIVEEGYAQAIESRPKHPFTELLLQSRPTFSDRDRPLAVIPGEPGNIAEVGCPFVHRCPKQIEACASQVSPYRSLEEAHRVACHLYEETNTSLIEVGAR